MTTAMPWVEKSPIEIEVKTRPVYAVTLGYEYPEWYKESGDTLSLAYKTAGSEEDPVAISAVDSAAGKYSVHLPVGTYDFTLSGTRFTDVTVNGVQVTGAADETDISSDPEKILKFKSPKLAVETNGFAEQLLGYNDEGGFDIASEGTLPQANRNQTYFMLNNVKATEGFVLRYSVRHTVCTGQYGNQVWRAGGFACRLDDIDTANNGLWCTLAPQYSWINSDNNAGGSDTRISMSAYYPTNNGGNWTSSQVTVNTANLAPATGDATQLDIEIAYYDGAFYVKITSPGQADEAKKVTAVRLDRSLFSAFATCSSSDPVYFSSAANYNNFYTGHPYAMTAGVNAAYDSEHDRSAAYFGEATRVLGFRALEANCHFTNVQYELGNAAALAAAKAMYLIAKDEPVKPCTHASRAWPATVTEQD